jgi:hypothetical protein
VTYTPKKSCEIQWILSQQSAWARSWEIFLIIANWKGRRSGFKRIPEPDVSFVPCRSESCNMTSDPSNHHQIFIKCGAKLSHLKLGKYVHISFADVERYCTSGWRIFCTKFQRLHFRYTAHPVIHTQLLTGFLWRWHEGTSILERSFPPVRPSPSVVCHDFQIVHR